jgi:hypothetical protein
MNSATQTVLFSTYENNNGGEKVRPYAHGDIVRVSAFGGVRVVVTHVSEDASGRAVLCGINLTTGADCVVLEREVIAKTSETTDRVAPETDEGGRATSFPAEAPKSREFLP